jgi:hypothetical protein
MSGEYQIEDITVEDFVRRFSLMISNHDTLKFGLLLALGDNMWASAKIALNDDPKLISLAINELVRLGFMRRIHDD